MTIDDGTCIGDARGLRISYRPRSVVRAGELSAPPETIERPDCLPLRRRLFDLSTDHERQHREGEFGYRCEVRQPEQGTDRTRRYEEEQGGSQGRMSAIRRRGNHPQRPRVDQHAEAGETDALDQRERPGRSPRSRTESCRRRVQRRGRGTPSSLPSRWGTTIPTLDEGDFGREPSQTHSRSRRPKRVAPAPGRPRRKAADSERRAIRVLGPPPREGSNSRSHFIRSRAIAADCASW